MIYVFILLCAPQSSHSSSSSSHPFSDEPGTLSSSKNDESNLSSATDFLHRFPALYVGSAPTGKLHAMNQAIEKVLMVAKPSQAKQGIVSLSLLEVQLDLNPLDNTAHKSKQNRNVLSHETSRIRTMGVYSSDKRFSGYIIKEVDMPQVVHVVMCNSAALMVSFTSFLRQSCQLTSHQRDGSFYEELSTDESGDLEGYPEVMMM